MKAKVIIENGKTTIILTPENEFETDVIEKLVKDKSELNTVADAKYSYGNYSNHSIDILIKDK